MKQAQHVFNCDRCQQRLRVPLIAGKKLNVTCRSCEHEMEISFEKRGAAFWSAAARRPKIFILAVICGLLGVLLMLAYTQQSLLRSTLEHKDSDTVRVL